MTPDPRIYTVAIEWKDEYKVGVEIIDRQHQRLIGVLSRLHEARERGTLTHDLLKTVIQDLETYVSRHFVTEEELMEIYGYPGLEGQKRAHQEFANKVKELRVLVMEGDLTVMTVIFRILETWLENHIIKEDRGIGPFLNKKGLS